MASNRVIIGSKKNIGKHVATKRPWQHHGLFPSVQAIVRPGKTSALQDVGHRINYPKFSALETQFRRQLDDAYSNRKTYSSRKVKQIFRQVYTTAFKLGKGAAQGAMGAGIPQVNRDDIAWIEKFIDKEFSFWKKFIADVEAGRGKLDYNKRREMYVQTLGSVYNAGRIIFSPPMTLYYWQTSLAEHCPHCLYLQSKSPFTKENIPTLPGSGDTKCKSNCKCHLKIEQVPVWKYMKVKKSSPTREELLRGMRVFSM